MERKKEIAVRAVYAINRILEKEHTSQTALAGELESKPSKFTEILKGRMLVPTDMMSLMCEKYDVSGDWLLTGIGEEWRGGVVQNIGDGSNHNTQVVGDASGEILALRKEIELLRTQLEEVKSEKAAYWELIVNLTKHQGS